VRVFVCLLFLPWAASFGRADTFNDSLYPILKEAGCPACHNTNGVASATRLHFPDANATPAQIEAFGKSLVRLVDRAHPEESLLLKKPTMRIPHTGGLRIKPGSPEEAALKSWIGRLSSLSGAELAQALNYTDQQPAGAAPVVVLRRLTHSQYNNTIRDLLGDQSQPANQFPSEDYVNGFRDQYNSQNLSALLAEAYSRAAEKLARNAFRNGDVHGLINCKSSSACRDTFVRDFGLRAFRRPLKADEIARYSGLFSQESEFTGGARLVVEAMLDSPNFLFRLDETSDPKLKPYAMASKLSYALWDTMPDGELMDAAARGELTSPQALETVTRHMLKDPRAHQALDEYVSQWLRFDRVLTTSRDRRRYPKFTHETAIAMTEEARRFVADLVWNDRNFMDAFSAEYTFVNAELASIYGVPAPAREFERVTFPSESERAGLLGQTLFLSLSSKPDDTSITGRGLFVREQFLCQHVPPPPAGVNTNLLPSTEAHPQTNRERMSEHVGNKYCAGCHNLMDPIGAGFEKFDAVGAMRDKYELRFYPAVHSDRRQPPKKVLLDLDTNGSVAGLPDAHFSSPRELGAILVKTPQCQECMVKQYFRYVSGRMETPADYPVIKRVTADFRTSQFYFQELIVSLARSWAEPGPEGALNVAHNYKAP
jgi:Protein of unknown function (DUF1592)/Protein of unknown function (DUF1588)/Protein of unknown function (DUF1587)/Protein of unknown function (DUF1595)/Protein of unknown function (DUF1585)